MRSTVIVQLGLLLASGPLVGCSFIDDFDKFHAERAGGDDDDGGVPANDAAPAPDKDATVPGTDAAPDAGGRADAGEPGVVDSSVAPDGAVDAGGQGVCGDGVTDTARGETCDDRNQVAGDGCEPVTCTATPSSTCAGKVCTDNDPCTVDSCDPSTVACTFRVIDADSDGYSPGFCRPGSGHMGGDCNDTSASINPAAVEICDGVDNNCDGRREIDEGLSKLRCYPDLDGDRFPNLDAPGVQACSCPSGTMVVTNPMDRTLHDCWDDPVTRGTDVFPGQTDFFEEGYGPGSRPMRSFDYVCDGVLTQRLGSLPDTCGGLLGLDCKAKVGYTNGVPSCGEGAEYTTCGMTGFNCEGRTDTRKQSCR